MFLESEKVYMISGFPIREYEPVPAPWTLKLEWKHGKETIWPTRTRTRTRTEALNMRHKISLRPDLMKRVILQSGDLSQTIWDVNWGYTI